MFIYWFISNRNILDTHRVPVLTEANDLGGEMRRAKAEAEEKEKQERLEREELERKRKYEEDLRNRT